VISLRSVLGSRKWSMVNCVSEVREERCFSCANLKGWAFMVSEVRDGSVAVALKSWGCLVNRTG